ncbi:outer membrane protein [Limoniibacter endophyticus]|uniref:Opacity-associated protein n=1 Tax=Limoniibacter endophyticus TaxID=1565040 RepID=A0A8J3GIE9_9HYPH|nr:outer membrane protein [Limoniibacter endophyticus]GHC76692.1 opacity-associated protein [Limoniibacter endophyticus]
MKALTKFATIATLLSASVSFAYSAELDGRPVPEIAIPEVVFKEQSSRGGWYLRGDLGYSFNDFRGVDGLAGLSLSESSVDDNFTIGLGVGYQFTDMLRADVTADYLASSDFDGRFASGGTITGSLDGALLLGNVYADLGTFAGFTPYVGAGIGGAYLRWDDLKATVGGVEESFDGGSKFRFAYALHAGASYCVTEKIAVDAGYRFTQVEGGSMIEGLADADDKGINQHQIRAGLRFQLGDGDGHCSQMKTSF